MNRNTIICILFYCITYIKADAQYFLAGGTSNVHLKFDDLNLLQHHRQKREVAHSAPFLPHNVTATTNVPPSTASAINNTTANNGTAIKGAPVNTTMTTSSTMNSLNVSTTTQVPLLGQNGTGIRKNVTSKIPKVSDPILPEDNLNITDLLQETPEKIKAEHHLGNLTYDNHIFYNSSFVGDVNYFNSYWKNITTAKADVHPILSNSHRRATTARLKFDFPYYGQLLHTVTVATGGFIYTGDHVHSWLAATQYIAPLMSNFDTTLTNNSVVKLSDDGTKFTVIWENVTLQEHKDKPFTFAVTLYKNGEIVFAYKTIPIPISDIGDDRHPVKVGISDAYLTDKILYFVRRKTIYEYHRISFMNHEITNNTILRLTPLPTCPQYTTCEACADHETTFNCSWCTQTQRCSSGIDRNKQDWVMRNCDKNPISNASSCPKPEPKEKETFSGNTDLTSYDTDTKKNPYHDAIFKTADADVSISGRAGAVPHVPAAAAAAPAVAVSASSDQSQRSPIGAVMAAFVVVVLITSLAGWILYAFKNPHTRSGQFLIKYRPSQWRWKRGEARYTAATIHM